MCLATQLSIGLSCSSPSEGRRATRNYALLLSDWINCRLAPKTVSTAFKHKLSIVYALWEAPVDTGADAH